MYVKQAATMGIGSNDSFDLDDDNTGPDLPFAIILPFAYDNAIKNAEIQKFH